MVAVDAGRGKPARLRVQPKSIVILLPVITFLFCI